MITVLFGAQLLTAGVVIAFTLIYVFASLAEEERRAVSAGIAIIAAMGTAELVASWLYAAGFFSHTPGRELFLAFAILATAGFFLLLRRTPPNPRALQGSTGLVTGRVRRFDEREQVFARERSMRPGTNQHRQFYEKHPHWEAADARRRSEGGILGTAGRIDRPGEKPNVAAMTAAFSVPPLFGTTGACQPPVADEGNRVAIDPVEATTRVKGFATHLGAQLVGVARLNANWI
jgi:hypothetical protein